MTATVPRIAEQAPVPGLSPRARIVAVLPLLAGALVLAAQCIIGVLLLRRPGFLGASEALRAAFLHFGLVLLLAGPCVLGSRRVRRFAVAVSVLPLAVVVAATGAAGQAPDMVLTVLTVSTCWCLGTLVLRALRLTGSTSLTAPVLGMVTAAILVMLLGRVGALQVETWGAFVVVVGAAWIAWSARSVRTQHVVAVVDAVASSASRAAAIVLALLQAAWGVFYAAAPEIQYDAVYGKAWLPAEWAEIGRIETMLEHPVLANVGTSQYVAVSGWLFDVDGVGRYLQVAAAMGLVLLLWQVGKGRSRPVVALAIVGFGLMPHLVWQMSTANDDLLLALTCAVAGAEVLTRSRGQLGSRNEVLRTGLLVGLLTGACVAAKLHLLVLGGCLALAWLVAVRGRPLQRLFAAGAGLLGAVLAAGPAMLLRYLDTGNPIFPQFNAFFRSVYFPPENTTLNFPFGSGSLRALVELPVFAVIRPGLYTEAVPPGAFGLMLVVLVAGLLAAAAQRRAGLAVAVAVFVALVAWWLQFRYLRYLLPHAAVATVLLARWDPRQRFTVRADRVVAAVAAGAALVYFPSVLAGFWNVPGRVPTDVALGRMSTASYEAASLPPARIITEFNRLAEPGAVITGDAYARILMRDDLDYSPIFELQQVAAARGLPTDSVDEIVSTWDELGVRWMAVTAVNRIAEEAKVPETPLAGLLKGRAQLVAAAGGLELYRVGPPAPQPRPVALCDPQLVGEACWTSGLDLTPGLTAAEAPAGVTQQLTPCPGAAYAVTAITTGAGAVVQLRFEGDPENAHFVRSVSVGAGELKALGSMPAGGSPILYLTVTAAEGATVSRVAVSQVAGEPCG